MVDDAGHALESAAGTFAVGRCAPAESVAGRNTTAEAPGGMLPSRPLPARGGHARTDPAARRVLLLAATYALPYRVMRCAREAHAETYVLGNLGAQVLALSRYCTKFSLSHAIIAGQYDAGLALEINCLAREVGATMILPGDAPSTRALIACRDLLEFPCFPLPTLEVFDLLNDKWRFSRLCDTLGICHPPTRLYSDADQLATEISAGQLPYPAVAKAPSWSASQGFVVLNGADAAAKAARINYRPVIVQQFIPGKDIVASIFCRNGAITAFMAHEYRKGVYSTFWSATVFADLGRIVAHLGADGAYNFDMIAAPDGKIHYLECNPRFFYKIDLSMLAGINFVAAGLEDAVAPHPLRVPHGTSVRRPEAVLTSPQCWPRLTRRDWAAARYAVSDPVPYLLDFFGWPT